MRYLCLRSTTQSEEQSEEGGGVTLLWRAAVTTQYLRPDLKEPLAASELVEPCTSTSGSRPQGAEKMPREATTACEW